VGAALVAHLQDLPELSDVASDLQDEGLQAFIEIDRDAASRLGISVADIDDALYSAFGQRQISTLFTQASQYRVVLEADPRMASGPSALESVFVESGSGRPVPLASIARVTERSAALLINHVGQFPAVTVSFNLGAGASLGEAVKPRSSAPPRSWSCPRRSRCSSRARRTRSAPRCRARSSSCSPRW
jgi:multidrug efflux pump